MREGWEVKTLGEVCIVERGSSPRPIKSFVTDAINGVNWVKIGDTKGVTKYISKTKQKITPEGAEKSRPVYPGDFILTNSMSYGKPYIMNTTGCIHDGWFVLRLGKDIDTDFFYYLLTSRLVQDQFGALAAGSVVKNISSELVKKAVLPLPPLAEQKRIVALLDEAFEGIELALAAATKNLKNARELFETTLNTTFTQKGEGWVETTLGEVAASVSTGPFGSMLHKSDYISNGTPIVNPINIVGGKIVPNEKKTVSGKTVNRLSSYVLNEGDVVIARRGEIGRCAVVTAEQAGWLCGTGCFYLASSELARPEFIAKLIRSEFYTKLLESVASGATMKNLSNKNLKLLPISIPESVCMQDGILESIEQLSTQTQRLETLYQQKIDALNELKQSLLQKAFAEELTAQAQPLEATG